ncbi:AAL161Wp [Eremothecium gossypii ATCC 10895]|uniref:AAL161Wp n=1 Tax=Eremothecium gossypii (strain ATCC 10895 / CBS 109.51 / FGSC 9923 / NRRL Y-1056) TaxID=284811 RepID=Q75FA3_EREGS|nr:AAL161Wp [Eremothecium gossypii ATCC 10895]AAS50205.1 AAL161Wp [Eremothecium gossypii ATCC 10895]AEY94490.1 FAAL161Wp [Eremothecium gossypii FDAG1]
MPESSSVPGVSQGSSTDKPKPCCVCKPEKEARDSCLLFNGVDAVKCQELVQKYKDCMKGYGFEV